MKRARLCAVMVVMLLGAACGGATDGATVTPEATMAVAGSVLHAPTDTACPTDRVYPADTVYPTDRVYPTSTPYPTHTPEPTETPTPVAPTATVEPTVPAAGTASPQEPTATATPTETAAVSTAGQDGAADQEGVTPTATAAHVPAGQVVELTRVADTDPGPPLTLQVSAVRIREDGSYKVTGMVRNDGGEIYGGIGAIATFYTGAPPPNHHGPVEVYAACPLLAPGAECPFSLEIYGREYVAYHLHPKGAPVDHQPAALAVSGLSVTHDGFGYVHIRGTATNANPFAVRDAYVAGMLMDASGRIASVGLAIVPGEIAPGAGVAFDVRVEEEGYSSYRVDAQARIHLDRP